jgi:PAT family beta-lactamase induction signal transducer AmpG
LDSADAGGLGLSTSEVGFVYGTVGLISLSIGGILGGYVASKKGLKYWIWWMLVAINLPNSVYIYLSSVLPDSFLIVNICVAIEQFGYGFGFTAYMLYMIYISDGDHKTSHFAIATGFMALGMMLPGMVSGWIQEQIGYQSFFMYVLLTTIPAFIITKFIDIDPKFGIKKVSNNGE